MANANFFHDGPLFGLDIGYSAMKVMQLESLPDKSYKVLGYGYINHSPEAIVNGAIVDFEGLNKSLYELLSSKLVGAITTRRVACTIPSSRTFSRPMKLPPMNEEDINEAVHLEAEQYIPIPQANLYLDYDITRQDEQGIELLMVATPKNIIDSYVRFLEGTELEPVVLEPTMDATARIFSVADASSNDPSILIDVGSLAIDMAVFDKTMFVNNNLQGGSDSMTGLIAKQLNVSAAEAYEYKNKYGISKGEKHKEILEAVKPVLDKLVRETEKIMRYYTERHDHHQQKIVQIVTIGGGANMPGLNEYLSEALHLPTRILDPWHKINFGNLAPPSTADRPVYITVTGEAIINPSELLR